MMMMNKIEKTNNVKRCIDAHGREEWKEYDENGRCIYHKRANRYEEWTEYDKQGARIHHKTSEGFEEWWKYGQKMNSIIKIPMGMNRGMMQREEF